MHFLRDLPHYINDGSHQHNQSSQHAHPRRPFFNPFHTLMTDDFNDVFTMMTECISTKSTMTWVASQGITSPSEKPYNHNITTLGAPRVVLLLVAAVAVAWMIGCLFITSWLHRVRGEPLTPYTYITPSRSLLESSPSFQIWGWWRGDEFVTVIQR